MVSFPVGLTCAGSCWIVQWLKSITLPVLGWAKSRKKGRKITAVKLAWGRTVRREGKAETIAVNARCWQIVSPMRQIEMPWYN
ncbi:MAG: hypothetical protein ABJQ70_10685 [Roseobacter sp.]